jgi:hypothetical protein
MYVFVGRVGNRDILFVSSLFLAGKEEIRRKSGNRSGLATQIVYGFRRP